MRVKFNYAQDGVVFKYVNDHMTLDDVMNLVRDPAIIAFSVTKETAGHYLTRVRKEREKEREKYE